MIATVHVCSTHYHAFVNISLQVKHTPIISLWGGPPCLGLQERKRRLKVGSPAVGSGGDRTTEVRLQLSPEPQSQAPLPQNRQPGAKPALRTPPPLLGTQGGPCCRHSCWLSQPLASRVRESRLPGQHSRASCRRAATEPSTGRTGRGGALKGPGTPPSLDTLWTAPSCPATALSELRGQAHAGDEPRESRGQRPA